MLSQCTVLLFLTKIIFHFVLLLQYYAVALSKYNDNCSILFSNVVPPFPKPALTQCVLRNLGFQTFTKQELLSQMSLRNTVSNSMFLVFSTGICSLRGAWIVTGTGVAALTCGVAAAHGGTQGCAFRMDRLGEPPGAPGGQLRAAPLPDCALSIGCQSCQ